MPHLSPETRMTRKWHRHQNRQLREAGLPVPVARKAYRVEVTAIEMPQWAIDQALKAVSVGENHVWLRSRTVAKNLSNLDKLRGGQGTVDTAEYRRCQICHRLLLGREAAETREWNRLHPGESKPCMDCKEVKR